MGLEQVFQKPEKPVEEKKLQVIQSEEAVVDELLAYFNRIVEKTHWGCGISWDKKYNYFFVETREDLQTYQIKPETIKSFNKKFVIPDWTGYSEQAGNKIDLGYFLATLI
ncbi:hypothetical protein HY643_04660 [Candidatus Woesearchaeota archaeon]|nr:hypothetical protein [Candidatus Woesearchaeota archaeon]